MQCNDWQRSSQPVEAGNSSQTSLMDDDEFKSVAGPEADDVEAAAVKQDVQAVDDDDLAGQPAAETVRTPLTNYVNLLDCYDIVVPVSV